MKLLQCLLLVLLASVASGMEDEDTASSSTSSSGDSSLSGDSSTVEAPVVISCPKTPENPNWYTDDETVAACEGTPPVGKDYVSYQNPTACAPPMDNYGVEGAASWKLTDVPGCEAMHAAGCPNDVPAGCIVVLEAATWDGDEINNHGRPVCYCDNV